VIGCEVIGLFDQMRDGDGCSVRSPPAGDLIREIEPQAG